MATIVDGVRQKPTYETLSQGFVTDQEVYLLNVGAGQFFTEGNAWGTQASVGETGLLVRFTSTGNGDYYLQDYSITKGGWHYTFFDSENQMYVDRNQQADYYFAVENNGSTFRLSTSSNNPTFGDYAGAGLYVGVPKTGSTTALSPFVDEDEAYVDWAIVTQENYTGLTEAIAIYEKAQRLKVVIDQIKAVNGDASAAEAVYLNESATKDELDEATRAAKIVYVKALVNNASDKDNVDVTSALSNPDFEYGLARAADPKGYSGDYGTAEGWVVDRNDGGNVTPGPLGTDLDERMIAAIGRTNHCFESWHCHDFDVYQEVEGLPVGVYEIEVQGYMRCEAPGYTRGDLAGLPNMPIYLYLNKATSQFPDVYSEKRNGWDYVTVENWTEESINGYSYPNSMGAAAQCFAHGMYKKNAYGLIATDADVLRIGVKGKTDKDAWVIFDNFKLTYRGFKPDVVKPVLDEAVNEVKEYESLLMGKTEFAALEKALSDAATAIQNNDGEAMFKALIDIYAVKDDARISKDLFDERGVNEDVQTLTDAIAATEGKKLAKATLQEAQTLLAAIKGNTKYEGTEIDQLKNDVTDAVQSLNYSVEVYAELNDAITSVKTAATKKANQALIDEVNTLVTTASEGYENGSLTSGAAYEMFQNLQAKQTAINASATEYAKLATAITNLKAAIAEASAETQHVAKSTLKKAQLRLDASQKVYDEGSVADADIAARVTAINELITELTKSIELYKQLAEGLAALKTELNKQSKVAAAVQSAAQQLYATAQADYEAGNTDDDKIEATVGQLNAAVSSLQNSATQYKKLADALPALEAAVQKKALQSLLDEATTLLTETKSAYEQATIADADIAARITAMNDKVSAINTSAEAYATLQAAIERLEAAIEEVGDEATKSSLKKANLRLTATKNLYNNGTIADADIPARVETIDQLIDDLTASKRLREAYDAAIESLDVAVSGAQGKVSQTMQQKAAALQASIKTDYEEGNVDDENVEAEIAKINNIVAALAAAPAAYDKAAQLTQQIDAIEQTQTTAAAVIAAAEQSAEVGYLTADYRAQAEQQIADGEAAHQTNIQKKTQLSADVAARVQALDNVDLTAGKASVETISNQLTTLLNSSYTLLDDSYMTGHVTEEEVKSCLNNSAYVVEMKGQWGTFCSIVDLDFSGVEGLKAYVATEFDADRVVVKLAEVNKVPARTGVLLVADEAGTFEIAAGNGSADFDSNLLVGNATKSEITAKTGDKTNFVLVAADEAAVFNPTKPGTLAAGKAYLSLAVSADVKSVGFFFEDQATGVRSLRYVADGAEWFDMTGKKLAGRPTKAGVYLRNGKKVAIK